MDVSSDLGIMRANQRQEFLAASAAESDLNLAFRLQMEEALAASVSLLHTSSSAAASAPVPAPASPQEEGVPSVSSSDADLAHALSMQSFELDRYEQELRDADLRRAELRRAAEDVCLRAHDERFAREIQSMLDDEWDDYGDEFEPPIKLLRVEEEIPFWLLFKAWGGRRL